MEARRAPEQGDQEADVLMHFRKTLLCLHVLQVLRTLHCSEQCAEWQISGRTLAESWQPAWHNQLRMSRAVCSQLSGR